ncbi:glycosyltransferase family 4 protein, partial [Patescibacteria group bacterium]|nr:glycosyltransferase family 4 protein [Patescibacteria group bacterium]MBU1970283.1 glycosyltransferase family 4 protein [Patescibacteria group bacterium]
GRWPLSGPLEKLPNCKFKTFIREPLPATLSLLISPLVFLYYLYWRFSNKPDLIHAHGHFGIWLYGYRVFLKKMLPWARELKIPLVVHFHNTAAGRETALEEQAAKVKFYSKHIAWPLAKLSDRWAIQAAQACVFVSQQNKEEAIKYYHADPSKCFVVETGVNTELFKQVGREEKEKIHRDLGVDPSDVLIVNHGIMTERKNIHLLIEALEFLPPFYKLFLVGPGDKEYMARLLMLIRDKSLGDRVIKAGYTPYPETAIAFQAAELFVLPSSFEGLPKVVLQSLACGTPALVSGFKTQEEIGGLFYLDSLEPKKIAEQILDIIENKKTTVDHNKIVGAYSWSEKAKEMERIYDLAKNSPPGK